MRWPRSSSSMESLRGSTGRPARKQMAPGVAGGVRTAGFPYIADKIWRGGPGAIEARMAFYGHLFLRPGRRAGGWRNCRPSRRSWRSSCPWSGWSGPRPGPRTPGSADGGGPLGLSATRPRPPAQGVHSAVRVVWKSLARLRWFARLGNAVAQRFVVRPLSQVTRYLTDDAIRGEIQPIVREKIGDDARVLLGHSLGSIVAYEVAHRLNRPLPLLVTLGSPLGVETLVLQRLRPPASFPSRVSRWVNVADRDDLVAAEPNLTNLFAVSMPRDAIFEGSYTVDNGAEPHSSEFYLGKDHIGRPVGQVLSTTDRTP